MAADPEVALVFGRLRARDGGACAAKDQNETVSELIQRRMDVGATDTPASVGNNNLQSAKPNLSSIGGLASLACMSPEYLDLLLGRGLDVHERSETGWTPLFAAAQNVFESCASRAVELLLDRGADPNARNSRGGTALMFGEHRRVTELLLAAGAEIDACDSRGMNALAHASQRGFVGPVEALLAAGADANKGDNGGRTALSHAASGKHESFAPRGNTLQCLIALLKAGADANKCDREGRTPLMHAVRSDKVKCVSALLSAGANASARTAEGWTALSLAVERGCPEAVELILRAGTRVDDRVVSLLLAAEKGYVHITRALLASGARLNGDARAIMALFVAANHLACVEQPLHDSSNPKQLW